MTKRSTSMPYAGPIRTIKTEAEHVAEGETMAVIAFQFLALHVQVLNRMRVAHVALFDSDDATNSVCKLVDGVGNTIAAVHLTVGDDGLTTLVSECRLSEAVHKCPNTLRRPS